VRCGSIGASADAIEALADDGQSVFGGEEQNTATAGDGETTQAWPGGSDGDGQVESEEGFAALGLAADDTDGFGAPEAFDEPALLGRDERELVSLAYR
jgi:hypothetical protein